MEKLNQFIEAINDKMLQRGAPVEKDFTGYNQLHFEFMSTLSMIPITKWTDKQKLAALKIFQKYQNTQLTVERDKINYYIDLLSSPTPVTSNSTVTVKNTSNVATVSTRKVTASNYSINECCLQWSYDPTMNKFVKEQDKKEKRWEQSDTWKLYVKWNALSIYKEKFISLGYDVSEIDAAIKSHEAGDLGNKPKSEISVIRRPSTIDTLEVSIKPNDGALLREIMDIIPYATRNVLATKSTISLPIEESAKLYDLLDGKVEGLKSLKPWADLVRPWTDEGTYKMVDIASTSIPFTPYPFQLEDVKRMLKEKSILNGNDMGCGKTMESVLTGGSLPMKKLVICPATLRLNWEREIHMIFPNADVNVVYSNKDFAIGNDWTIIGYSSVDKFQQELEDEKFQCIFIDEAHYCQAINNYGAPNSKRAKVILRLCATSEYVYPLSGTPKTNRNKNLYNILRMIRHDITRRHGDWSFRDFGITYCDGQDNGYGMDYNGNSNDEDFHKELVPKMVRHLKKEVLPNLTKQRQIIPVKVNLKAYYKQVKEYMKGIKTSQGAQLVELAKARQLLAAAKVDETIEFVKNFINQDQKVVIVTCFTEVVEKVEETFAGNVVKLVGGMSDDKKADAINHFQNGNEQVMVMNIIAGGVGVTLTKSHILIFNDYDFVPGNVIQAEDRVCRSGQTECCMIYYVTAKGAYVDEYFTALLTDKIDTINSVVDGGTGEVIDFRELLKKEYI